MSVPTFESGAYLTNLSARALSHAVRVTFSFAAVREYASFSAGVTRRWIWAVAGSLMGGLPLGRLGSMPELSPTQIILAISP